MSVAQPGVQSRLTRSTLGFLSLALAAGLGLLHWRMVDVHNLDFMRSWHSAILEGRGPYPEQYRFLTFFLAEGLVRLGLPVTGAHTLLRLLFTFASLYAFTRYLEGWFRPMTSLLGLYMLAAVLPFTYLFYRMQVTDPLNLLIFILALWAMRDRRDLALYPLIVVGMLNRETAILIPVLYACVRAGTAPLRSWLPHALALALLAAGIYAGLRLVFGLRAPYTDSGVGSLLGYWRFNAGHWAGWVQVLAFFNLALILVWRGLSRRPVFLRRALWIVPILVAIHFSVGHLREIRLYLPLVPILVPLTLMALEERFEPRPASEA
jgi:hypothetical protein